MISKNISVNEAGHLCFAGQDVCDLAERFGTPLYLLDEDRIRENCRLYKTAFAENFGEKAAPAYASKAASFVHMYRVMREEEMCIDVVSSGEIFTAVKAGFPMERAFFHSNNKTDADILYAMDAGVGYFVVDGEDELVRLSELASARGAVQKILLRVTACPWRVSTAMWDPRCLTRMCTSARRISCCPSWRRCAMNSGLPRRS